MFSKATTYADFKEELRQHGIVTVQDVEGELYQFRLRDDGKIEHRRRNGSPSWTIVNTAILREQFLIGPHASAFARVG